MPTLTKMWGSVRWGGGGSKLSKKVWDHIWTAPNSCPSELINAENWELNATVQATVKCTCVVSHRVGEIGWSDATVIIFFFSPGYRNHM